MSYKMHVKSHMKSQNECKPTHVSQNARKTTEGYNNIHIKPHLGSQNTRKTTHESQNTRKPRLISQNAR